MPPTLNPQAPTHFRTKRSQSVCHTKKLHICEVDNCFQTFKRAEHLKRHQRCVHFDHRPYQCPIPTCNKFFSRTDNLAAHIKIHQRRNSTLN
ncbi:hypothetical protein CONCODRAFT_55634 [Conidiobolus coronatus NRRL 28638]|uniref:C2H2-type domain-containing protein n=1 Tax=Conidiobolus coronatus (strain ATCC 28846 / CBS 209.66 / NRRL 28638) TaxID=796925 RepID=A0A137PE75_CONC2|nr:hypothetical protein CONCODRAFT_55634 [Conidiobolus coronatus NRRL 28638]|eukprot:KXN73314.1 hypothetical protein CONCODRAFT_55634 [Conidiobolus coronatus NRRL 28638]